MSQDMQEDVTSFRQELLRDLKDELELMEDGPAKEEFERKVNQYEKQVMADGKPTHTRMWYACDMVGCDPINIQNTKLKLPHFSCALGECDKCGTYNAPELELNSD